MFRAKETKIICKYCKSDVKYVYVKKWWFIKWLVVYCAICRKKI